MEVKKSNRNNHSIDTTINIINYFGWALTFISIVGSAIFYFTDKSKSDKFLAISLFLLKFVQTLQISEIFLALANNGAFPILSFMQITGRLFTTWGFMASENPYILNFLIIFSWSLSDCIRTLYYILKESKLLGMLRYNLFIVNYPIGFFSELALMNLYINKSNDSNFVYFMRFIQISFLIGFGFLYVHLLKNRKNYMRNIKNKNK